MSRILIVDDEPIYRRCLEHALVCQGYEVTTAEKVETAVAAFNDSPTDLLICDWHLGPGVTGRDVALAIGEQHRRPKSIAITGMTDVGLLEQALSSFDSLLFKPFTVDQLLKLVDKALSEDSQTSETGDRPV